MSAHRQNLKLDNANHGLVSVDRAIELAVKGAVADAVRDLLEERLVEVVRREIHAAFGDNERAGNGDGWISPKQAAELTGFTYDTILDWINDGKLKAQRINRNIRIAREDLQAFMGQHAPRRRVSDKEIDDEAAQILRQCGKVKTGS